MRLGLNTLIRDPDDQTQWIPIETMIDLAIELGLDLIDVHLDRGLRSLDDAYLRSIRERCTSSGLDIGYAGVGHGFVGVREHDATITADALAADEWEDRVSEVEQGIDAAITLGAPLVRLFAGAIPEQTPDHDSIWVAAVSAFHRVATYADNRGVRIGLHNHPPAVAPTGEDILRLIRDIDQPNGTVIMDTGQWHGSPGTNLQGTSDPEVDFYAYMAQVAPQTSYVRAKIYRIDSGMEEWLDYPRIVGILKAAQYDGPISIVYEDRNNQSASPAALHLAVNQLRALL